MEETQESQMSAAPIDEDVDHLPHHEIDVITEGLNFGSLSSFDANVELHSAQDKDEYIINNVGTQAGISKALEHGVRLSSIVKAKALRLNETTSVELLDVILGIYREHFSKQLGTEGTAEEQQTVEVENESQEVADMVGERELDFVAVSKFFSSQVLTYSSLSWETLPMVGSALETPEPTRKRKRSQAANVYNEPPRKELATMVEYNQTLETEKHTNVVKNRLLQQSSAGWVNFWEFVLEDDPSEGYTKTCLNIYALTFLTVKGFIAYRENEDGEIHIKASEEPIEDGENSQGIVTGLSYQKWESLVQKHKQSQSKSM